MRIPLRIVVATSWPLLLGLACTTTETVVVDDDAGPAVDYTAECEAICVPKFPGHEAEYRELRKCFLCGACADACGGSGLDICEPAVEQGCSAAASDCASCSNSACALEKFPDGNYGGICAGAASVCGGFLDCVQLNNCVAQCAQDAAANGGVTP